MPLKLIRFGGGKCKIIFAKFMPGSDKYQEAWTPVDTVVSAAKKRIHQFPTIVKRNSVQMRQYQEIVSELIGIFEEHNFLHNLSSQVPKATVSKLPACLCGQIGQVCLRKTKIVNLGFICKLARERGKN